MRKFIDLTGGKFGRLTVIERAANRERKAAYLCRCECGKGTVVLRRSLIRGATKSCGCYNKERATETHFKHGHTTARERTSEYMIWIAAKARCFNPKNKRFKDYGGRGIAVCPEWRDSFAAFFAYIGKRPPGLTLDRYPNNDGNYEPGNVRWATRKEQQNNRRPKGNKL